MSKKVKVILILSLLALALIGVLLYEYFKDYLHNNSDDVLGNTAANLNNGGYVCQIDGKVYFANAFDENRLYEMNVDETKIKKVCDNPASNINADDKYVFFYVNDLSSVSGLGGFSMAQLGLFRVDRKKHSTKQLDRVTCGVVKLVGNELFYQRYDNDEGVHLQSYNIRSNESKVYNDVEISPACVVQNRIYYAGITSDHYLRTKEIAVDADNVLLDVNVWNPDYQGKYIYFMNIDDGYKLYRYEAAQKSLEKLTEDRVDSFIVAGGYIFYQKNDKDSPALMAMGLDGANPRVVEDGNFSQLGATDSYLYCVRFGQEGMMYHLPLDGSMRLVPFQAAQDAVKK